jgi:excisionase family DNA binding protein
MREDGRRYWSPGGFESRALLPPPSKPRYEPIATEVYMHSFGSFGTLGLWCANRCIRAGMSAEPLVRVVLDALDDDALDLLAARVAGRLVVPVSAPYDDRWIDAKQAAEYLGTTRSSLWKLTAAREIPFSQDGPGCKCWFKRSQLDAWREGA